MVLNGLLKRSHKPVLINLQEVKQVLFPNQNKRHRMRKNNLLLSFFLLSTILIFTNCTKQDTVNNNNQIQGTWIVTDIYSDYPYDWDNDGYTETDIFNTYSYCQRDISLNFQQNGFGQARQGCDAPIENMSWQLYNNRLDLFIPSGDINLAITQFDGNTLKGYDQVYVNGRTYNINYTLSRRY